MAVTARGPAEQQKQPQSCPKGPSNYHVAHEMAARESRPAG